MKNDCFRFIKKFIYLNCLFYSTFVLSQKSEVFTQYVDSASKYVHSNPELTWEYLKRIPEPVQKSIEGKLADYYMVKGMLYHKSNEQAKLFNSFVLAIRYAEKEKNYDIAGQASLDLFSNIYVINKDSTAYKYLEQAKKYYTLANNQNGLIEVIQMPAYVAFQDNDFEKSNKLLLENLELFKSVEDDAYYSLFANFMLASNYIHLGDLKNSNKYLKEFKKLKEDPTIDPYNYNAYQVNLNICMGEIHLSKKHLDSSLYYLNKAKSSRDFMDFVAVKNFYKYMASVYKLKGETNLSNNYSDSLVIFEAKMLDNTLQTSFQINDILLQSEEELKAESWKKEINSYISIVLIVLLIGVIVVFIFSYKKLKMKLNDIIKQLKNYTYLSTSHEKLKIKTLALEEYISVLKKDIKTISAIDEVSEQKKRVKELYKNIHLEYSNLLGDGENHLKLINNLNVGFFAELKSMYPKLNESESLICYFLAMGFKSKEIAFFMGRSIRAVESRRYRISKKMGLDKGNESLIEHLKTVLQMPDDSPYVGNI